MSETSKYKIYLDGTERFEKKVSLIEVSGGKEKVIEEMTGDIDLASFIRDLLKKNGLKPSQIDEFVPNLGPGSFTGLKISVTLANVANWALGRKKISELDKPDYGRDPNITLKKF